MVTMLFSLGLGTGKTSEPEVARLMTSLMTSAIWRHFPFFSLLRDYIYIFIEIYFLLYYYVLVPFCGEYKLFIIHPGTMGHMSAGRMVGHPALHQS